MVLPLTIILGILTITSLFTTATLGYLSTKGKPVFKYHRFFAFLTIILAITHASLVIQKYYF